jgi:hypothetical protein
MPQEVIAHIGDEHGHKATVENGALAVAVQDQHSRKVGSWALMATGARLPIISGVAINSYEIELGTGHGLSIGNEIFISTTSRSQSFKVLDVVGNDITLDSPLAFNAAPNVAGLIAVTSNMAVDGSTTRKTFVVTVPEVGTNSLDIKGLRVHISDGTDMDDGRFGGITPALARGVVIRKYTPAIWPANESAEHYFNIKSNADFQIQMDNMDYLDKAPSGEYALISDWKVDNDDGVTSRINPGDRLEVIISDDLTDLISMRMWFYGHIVLEDVA